MTRVLLALTVAAPLAGWAQRDDDAPIPYQDEEALPRAVHRQRPSDETREEDEEALESRRRVGHLDDPNVGLSAEVLAGAMLLESSRGAWVDPRFMFGVRVTWEWARLLSDEFLREMFFADLGWQFTTTSDGTTEVHARSTIHYFTLAPAIAWRFGHSPVAAFAQLGAGFAYMDNLLTADGVDYGMAATKFLFQYGLGVRFRPTIVTVEGRSVLRLSFRIEVTRFLRGYLSDTFVGGSVGVTF